MKVKEKDPSRLRGRGVEVCLSTLFYRSILRKALCWVRLKDDFISSLNNRQKISPLLNKEENRKWKSQ